MSGKTLPEMKYLHAATPAPAPHRVLVGSLPPKEEAPKLPPLVREGGWVTGGPGKPDPFLYAFLKVRNEIVREGNLYLVLDHLASLADGGVLCDDASYDGTTEVLIEFVRTHPGFDLLLVEPKDQHFGKELRIKEEMLGRLHTMPACTWVLWLDGDELVDKAWLLRPWLKEYSGKAMGLRMHYTQLWRNASWARTDQGFDRGEFVKVWRYTKDLTFDVKDGTHYSQFPKTITFQKTDLAPFEVIHRGNYGKNLVWKCIQYTGGLGDVPRHLSFEKAEYRNLGGGDPMPRPFTEGECKKILAMGNLSQLEKTFCVILPTLNRVGTLDAALESLLAQTYEKWVCFVLDDGSRDNTPELMQRWQEKDPRIFYARYPENRGGVAMNEIGMRIACETASWWTRLGSDDYFGPNKLACDAKVFATGAEAIFAPYRVKRGSTLGESCNGQASPEAIRKILLEEKNFVCSWANCAIATRVLRAIHNLYGNFVPPEIRNMEDVVVNARVARLVDWTWRSAEGVDAVWNTGADGASANQEQCRRDGQLSRRVVAEDGGEL